MTREIAPNMQGGSVRVGIAVARFNQYVTYQMLDLCVSRLAALGVKGSAVTVIRVPGSFELPLAARKLALRDDIDAVITLGAVIRGETAHFDHVAYAASMGAARVAEETGKPVVFGVLTTDTTDQAVARIGHAAGYAEAAVEMANTYRALGDI
jgi:6,7-dimethyl-8-ribityllumazine synthase